MTTSQRAVAAASKAKEDGLLGVPWDSLASLNDFMFRHAGSRPYVSIDNEWFQYIHRSEDSVFTSTSRHLLRLMEGKLGDKCTAIFDEAGKAVQRYRQGEFMGPMCSPLTKIRARQLVGGDYLVTEKSDGLRCVLYTAYVPGFPTWIAERVPSQNGVTGGNQPFTFTLFDCAALENARGVMLGHAQSKSDPIRFGGAFGTGVMQPLSADPSATFDTFSLTVTTSATANPDVAPATFIARRTTTRGRYFTYLFDRSMSSPSLLLEEITFPNLSNCILDGELLLPRGSNSLLFAAFDAFSFTCRGIDPSSGKPYPFESLTFQTMRDRYAVMGDTIMGPMEDYYSRFNLQLQSLRVVRKRMFEMHELRSLVRHLRTTPDGRHTYADVTYNDGLIFTPNRFDLAAGAAEAQLKWKWPDTLTIDWELCPIPSRRGWYNVLMFFKKKRVNSDHKEVSETIGHTGYAACEVLNPHNYPIANNAIAECSLDAVSGHWKICRVREDKIEPNSAVTVVSVMESICEKLDLESLLQLLEGAEGAAPTAGGDDESLHPPAEPITSTPAPPTAALPSSHGIVSTVSVEPVNLILRCTHEKDGSTAMRLQWTIKLPGEKHPIVCSHCYVATSCYGLGCPPPDSENGESFGDEEGNSRLEGLLAIKLANDGGCYAWSDTTVEAQFDAKRGMWALGRLGRQKPLAQINKVIKHLEQIAAITSNPALRLAPLENLDMGEPAEASTTAEGANSNRHYAERTKELRFESTERSQLRRHNGWIKAVLIAESVRDILLQHPSAVAAKTGKQKLAILDMCCGRGGDLQKWKEYPVRYLMMVDSCFDAVAAAAQRYSVGQGLSTRVVENRPGYPGVKAHFHVVDCFSQGLQTAIDRQRTQESTLANGFDIVSCQFSMHYAFSSEETVKQMLKNIATALRPGGLFVATTGDDRILKAWAPSRFNEAFSVDFLSTEDSAKISTFGAAYRVSYDVAVKSEVEFVVPWEAFVRLASNEGLDCLSTENFSDFRSRAKETRLGREMWGVIGGKDTGLKGHRSVELFDDVAAAVAANGEPPVGVKRTSSGDAVPYSSASAAAEAIDPTDVLSADELEAASMYRTLTFKRR